MSEQNRKRQRPNEDDNDNSRFEVSEWSMDTIEDGNQLKELKWKMADMESKNALLNAKNQVLEGKLENVELKAQINALKEENKVSGKKLKDAEQKAEMKENMLKETIHANHQDVEELKKEIANLKEQQKQTVSWDQIQPDILWNHLIKAKKVCNPENNFWNNDTEALISSNELQASNNSEEIVNVFAEKGFPISGESCRPHHFFGTIIYYFEVSQKSSGGPGRDFVVGLSDGSIPNGSNLGESANSYALDGWFNCSLAGKDHEIEWPNGTIRPNYVRDEGVYGCGLTLDSKINWQYSSHGMAFYWPIQITNPAVDQLYPTVSIADMSVKANFGNDPAKPFKYDIEKCPGMVFE